MISSKNIKALQTLCDKLSGMDWRLIGSSNLALQGVDIEAKDVDIRVRIDDVQVIKRILQPYCKQQIECSQSGGYSSIFGQFNIEGVQVDVMAGGVEKDGVRIGDVLAIEPTIIEVNRSSIPCVDLKAEYDAYISLGRKEKADLIKFVIDNSTK